MTDMPNPAKPRPIACWNQMHDCKTQTARSPVSKAYGHRAVALGLVMLAILLTTIIKPVQGRFNDIF